MMRAVIGARLAPRKDEELVPGEIKHGRGAEICSPCASVRHPGGGEPEKPGPWYAGRLVRLILVLLALFFVLHIALWKVVYDFILDTDHNRLHDTVQTAWTRLKETVNALD